MSEFFSRLTNFSFLPKYAPYFIKGLECTLIISVLAVFAAILPAMLLALMRLSKSKVLRGLSGAYISIFRSTPMLVQLYIVYFGPFGVINLPSYKLFGFIDTAMLIPGVIALALNSSAYVAEIIRAGILAVDQGQTEAARCLGLTQAQAMRYVVLPQAIKNIIPTLANELVTMVKESSIVGYLGVQDLMWGTRTTVGATFIPLSPYVLAAAIYFCINYPAGKAIELLERRMRRGDVR